MLTYMAMVATLKIDGRNKNIHFFNFVFILRKPGRRMNLIADHGYYFEDFNFKLSVFVHTFMFF